VDSLDRFVGNGRGEENSVDDRLVLGVGGRQLDADGLAVADDDLVEDLVKVVNRKADVRISHLFRVTLSDKRERMMLGYINRDNELFCVTIRVDGK
jgi:hypothetical protein